MASRTNKISNLPRTAPANIGIYALHDELGRGGMGAVFVGEHTVDKRQVAIKILLGTYASDPVMRARFLNEALAVARLDHPNVARVHDFGELDNGALYLISELINGEGLRSRLDREGSLPIDRAVKLASQIAAGLACAHAAGVVHRDLKPSNLMLVADPEAAFGERVKVLDFSVAKIQNYQGSASGLTPAGALVGTPGFMSPELCRGLKNIDHRSDIYSLGVLLYLFLAGRMPFEADEVHDLLAMHIQQDPAPLSSLFVDVPRELDAIVLTCLAKRPADRFRSMAEVIAALDALGSLSPMRLRARRRNPLASLPLPAPTEPSIRLSDVLDDVTSTQTDAVALPPVPDLDDLDLAPPPSADAPTPIAPTAAPRTGRRRWRGLALGAMVALGITAVTVAWPSRPAHELETAIAAPPLEPARPATPVTPIALVVPERVPAVAAPSPAPAKPAVAMAAPSAPTPEPEPAAVADVAVADVAEANVAAPDEPSPAPAATAAPKRDAKPRRAAAPTEPRQRRAARTERSEERAPRAEIGKDPSEFERPVF